MIPTIAGIIETTSKNVEKIFRELVIHRKFKTLENMRQPKLAGILRGVPDD